MSETKYERATELLKPFWNEWVEAERRMIAARERYRLEARNAEARICDHCLKPMPDDDTSRYCDGCHLPWGWATPQGQRELRAAQLDRQLEALQKEREELRAKGA